MFSNIFKEVHRAVGVGSQYEVAVGIPAILRIDLFHFQSCFGSNRPSAIAASGRIDSSSCWQSKRHLSSQFPSCLRLPFGIDRLFCPSLVTDFETPGSFFEV